MWIHPVNLAESVGFSQRTIYRHLKSGILHKNEKHQVEVNIDISRISVDYCKTIVAAKKLGVSRSWVLNRIHSGQLEAIRLGPSQFRVKISSLEKLINGQEI